MKNSNILKQAYIIRILEINKLFRLVARDYCDQMFRYTSQKQFKLTGQKELKNDVETLDDYLVHMDKREDHYKDKPFIEELEDLSIEELNAFENMVIDVLDLEGTGDSSVPTVQEIQKQIIKRREDEKREIQDLIWQAKEDHTLMAGPGALTDKESKQVKEQAKRKLYEKYGITVIDTDSNADKDWVKVKTGSKLGEYEVNGDNRTLRAGFVKGDVEKNKNFVRMRPNSIIEINDTIDGKPNVQTTTIDNIDNEQNRNVDLNKFIDNRKYFEQSGLSRTNESQWEKNFRKLTDKSHQYAQNIAREKKVKDWHKENAKDIFVSDKDMLDALNAGPISPNMPKPQGLQNNQDQSIPTEINDLLKKYPSVIEIPMNNDGKVNYYYNEPIQKKKDIKNILENK